MYEFFVEIFVKKRIFVQKNPEIQDYILPKQVWKSNLLYGGGGGQNFSGIAQ